MKNIYISFLMVICGFLIISCNQKDDFAGDTPEAYQNIGIGKYITYQMDSILYINFGQKDTAIKYQAKDVIDGAITDALGRPAWRVVRYLRDSAGLTPWKENITYMLVPTREAVEIVENNLRFIKLKLPIRNDFSWKGNSYINTNSSDPLWIFKFYDDWDYTYAKVGESFKPITTVIPNTITINQIDEVLGQPGNKAAYSERSFSKEVYAKGIGMVYRDFIHWTFQSQNSTYPNGYYQGFGVKMRMIDYN